MTFEQISLERMDELFGVANFSGIEDIGRAAKNPHDEEEKGHAETVETPVHHEK